MSRADRGRRRGEMRLSASARGYNTQWQDLQRKHLKHNTVCVRCGQRAEMVDHVVPIKDAPHLRLDPNNMQSLCRRCHAIKTARKDYGKSSGVMPDTNYKGYPMDPEHPWNKDSN